VDFVLQVDNVCDALNVERGARQNHVMAFEIEICSRVRRR